MLLNFPYCYLLIRITFFLRFSYCNRRYPRGNLRKSKRRDTRTVGSNNLDTSQRKTLKNGCLAIIQTLWIHLKHKWRMSPSRFDSHEDRVDNRAALRRSVRGTKLFSSRGKVVNMRNHSPPWKKKIKTAFLCFCWYPSQFFVNVYRNTTLRVFSTLRQCALCIAQPHFPSFCCYDGVTIPVSPWLCLYHLNKAPHYFAFSV